MTPREIIAKAWAITTTEGRLRRWGFIAALFETTRNVEMILYQAYYLYWYSKGETVGWLTVEVWLLDTLPFWGFVAVTAALIILLLLQMIIPTLADGAIIGLSAKAYRKEEVKGGLVLAIYNFFPLLEIHGMFAFSSIALALTASSSTVRYIEGDLKIPVLILIAVLWSISSLFKFLASFGEEGIVINKIGVFTSIGRSLKLIVSHISHIVFLLLLLLVISLRIVINAAMILVLPGILIGLGLLLAMFLSKVVSIIISGIVGIILLVVLSYFFAYLQVFQQTVWTITYMELNKLKDLDVIEENV